MRFCKMYNCVLDECQNITQWCIVCFILALWDGRKNPKIQQTYLIDKLYLDKRTFRNNLKQIREKGLLSYKPSFIEIKGIKYKTTEFEITDKLKKLLENEKKNTAVANQKEETSKPKTETNETANEIQNIWRNLKIQ